MAQTSYFYPEVPSESNSNGSSGLFSIQDSNTSSTASTFEDKLVDSSERLTIVDPQSGSQTRDGMNGLIYEEPVLNFDAKNDAYRQSLILPECSNTFNNNLTRDVFRPGSSHHTVFEHLTQTLDKGVFDNQYQPHLEMHTFAPPDGVSLLYDETLTSTGSEFRHTKLSRQTITPTAHASLDPENVMSSPAESAELHLPYFPHQENTTSTLNPIPSTPQPPTDTAINPALLDTSYYQQTHSSTVSPSSANPQALTSTTTNATTIACPFLSCPKTFRRRYECTRHYNSIHLGIRGHCFVTSCDNNHGKGFCRPEKLRKHWREKHGDLLMYGNE